MKREKKKRSRILFFISGPNSAPLQKKKEGRTQQRGKGGQLLAEEEEEEIKEKIRDGRVYTGRSSLAPNFLINLRRPRRISAKLSEDRESGEREEGKEKVFFLPL